MSAPRDPFDLRRAGEDVLLDALRAGHPLALAEAYHRSVPAGHAVARRLMSGAEDVEDLLLAVYTKLWTDAPATGPLEGWVRRTAWSLGIERLRATGTPPASPSAAGLIPDLPAPDVRFLDAAERAIADLPEEQRRALLLAHDKGVPTAGQDEGAARSLTHALLALAGPEASGGDRDAMEADDCGDLTGLGDWCLGLATSREQAQVDDAVADRPGCAATARAVRRGRRRVEGLPATPDMGQRILVSVLTTSGRVVTPTADDPAGVPTAGADLGTDESGRDADPESGPEGTDAAADMAGVVLLPDAQDDEGGYRSEDFDEDGHLTGDDVLDPTAPMAPIIDPDAVTEAGPEAEVVSDEPDPFAPPRDTFHDDEDRDPFDDPTDPFGVPASATADAAAPAEATVSDDPFGGPDEDGDAVATPTDPVGDTADLAQADDDTAAAAGAGADWRPDPGSTAELRLSDILAEGDDDDPFAGLDDDDDPFADDGPAPQRPGGDPYAALRGLDGEPDPAAQQPATGPLAPVEEDDAHLVGGYVEGQETAEVREPARAGGGSGAMAAALSWILPIVGGSALGVLIAILVFGPPT